MKLKWTNDIPKLTGWYWVRDQGEVSVSWIEVADIVRIRDGRLPSNAQQWELEYAGPIDEPE